MLAARRAGAPIVPSETFPMRPMPSEELWMLCADDGEERLVTVRHRIERTMGADGTERFRREVNWIRDDAGREFELGDDGTVLERGSGRRFRRGGG